MEAKRKGVSTLNDDALSKAVGGQGPIRELTIPCPKCGDVMDFRGRFGASRATGQYVCRRCRHIEVRPIVK